MQNNFFGSKLNSVLLLVLIVLMVFALRIMLKDKETYLPKMAESGQKVVQDKVETSLQQSFVSGDIVDFVKNFRSDKFDLVFAQESIMPERAFVLTEKVANPSSAYYECGLDFKSGSNPCMFVVDKVETSEFSEADYPKLVGVWPDDKTKLKYPKSFSNIYYNSFSSEDFGFPVQGDHIDFNSAVVYKGCTVSAQMWRLDTKTGEFTLEIDTPPEPYDFDCGDLHINNN